MMNMRSVVFFLTILLSLQLAFSDDDEGGSGSSSKSSSISGIWTKLFGSSSGGGLVINGDSNYVVTWSLNTTHITFLFACTLSGWAGIGWTKAATVHSSTDMYVSWITTSGAGEVVDGYSSTKDQPVADSQQDAFVVNASLTGTKYSLAFTRKLNTGDANDIAITAADTFTVGWGYHSSSNPNSVTPKTATYAQHTVKGSTTANFFTGGSAGLIQIPKENAGLYMLIVMPILMVYACASCCHNRCCKTKRDGGRVPPPSEKQKAYYLGSQEMDYPEGEVDDGEGGGARKQKKSKDSYGHYAEVAGPKNTTDGLRLMLHWVSRARIPKTQIQVLDVLIGGIYLIINIILIFNVGVKNGFAPVESWGYMCTGNAFLLAIPATRNSVLVWLMGIPFDRAILHHRWLGRITVVEGIVHFALGYSKLYTGDKYTRGLVAVISLMIIFVSSLETVRRKFFTGFFFTHHLFILFYLFGALHSEKFRGYAIAATVFYGLDRLIRLLWGNFPQKIVSAKVFNSNVVKVRFSRYSGSKYDVGQYVFVNFPGISLLEWHPFSLCSGPQEKDCEITIKSLGNYTRKLIETCEKDQNLTIRIDGPYGKLPFNYQRYSTLLLVAGGIGVTPCMSILRHIYHYKRSSATHEPILKNVIFIWTVRSLKEREIFNEELNHILSKGQEYPFPRLQAEIHVTGAVNEAEVEIPPEVRFERPDFKEVFQQVSDCVDERSNRCAVIACGPASMINQVWDMTTSKGMNKIRFDFHHETFEF